MNRAGSHLEEQLAMQLRAAGLPQPEREARVIPERRFRADFAWPAHGLVCEVEGGLYGRSPSHSSIRGILRDMEKASLYAIAGYRLVRVGEKHIRDGRALAWIEAALEFHGHGTEEQVETRDE